MWSPLVVQTAALDAPSAAASLSNMTGLWHDPAAAWTGTVAPQQHLSPVAPQRELAPSPSSPQVAWGTGSPQPDPHAGSNHTVAAKIYVQGLPQNLQHPVAVAGLFSPFGDVLDVKLYAAEVRLSGGSAVVRMRSSTQAAAAIASLNGMVPDGGWQQLTVRAAETAEQRSSRITAINGRQQGNGLPLGSSGHPASPMHALSSPGALSLPPAGPGGAAAAALRRVHSARTSGSHGSLHCYTSGLVGEGGALARPSLDWSLPGGRDHSMDGSQRSSLDVMRCASAAFACASSDSGSGGEGSGGEEGVGGEGAAANSPTAPPSEAQRMLLEAVLALVGQVEGGQLSLAAMRAALESALFATKQGPTGADQPQLLPAQGSNNGRGQPTAVHA